MRCYHCNTHITNDDEFTYRGRQFCMNCASALISWMLDGGMVDEPKLFAYVFAKKPMKVQRREAREALANCGVDA